MAGDTASDAFVPSAYLNGFIVYPGAVSQSSKICFEDDQYGSAVTGFFYIMR